jgi:transcriptional regulator with XRE-family HTH domain
MSKIRELREARGMTQADLARLLGVSDNTVHRWEAGVSVPQRHIRRSLAKRLGVAVDQLGLTEDE